jgi:hypothetical protein
LDAVGARAEKSVVGVYGQVYRHCSEPTELVAPVNRAAWLGLVKASTLTTKNEYEQSERNYDVRCIEQDCVVVG